MGSRPNGCRPSGHKPFNVAAPSFKPEIRLVQSGLVSNALAYQMSVKHNFNSILGPFTLAKTKIQKTWFFCCTVYTARKTHNIRGFWHEKRMREKTRISYLCFGKWCACATSLYL